MVAVRFEVAAPAVAMKLVVVVLRGTVTEAGTLTVDTSLLDKDTVVPFPGAALGSITVQVVEVDAVRVLVAHCKEIGAAVTVIVNVLLDPLMVAVIVAFWFDATGPAVAVKFAVVVPWATVAEVGRLNMEPVLLESATTVPTAGAALERVTVQAVVEDSGRLVLAHARDVREIGAVTATVTDWLVPL
jgi:hypothetical protein